MCRWSEFITGGAEARRRRQVMRKDEFEPKNYDSEPNKLKTPQKIRDLLAKVVFGITVKFTKIKSQAKGKRARVKGQANCRNGLNFGKIEK